MRKQLKCKTLGMSHMWRWYKFSINSGNDYLFLHVDRAKCGKATDVEVNYKRKQQQHQHQQKQQQINKQKQQFHNVMMMMATSNEEKKKNC